VLFAFFIFVLTHFFTLFLVVAVAAAFGATDATPDEKCVYSHHAMMRISWAFKSNYNLLVVFSTLYNK
jgi:zona occludens toxin (predicted ATPase)